MTITILGNPITKKNSQQILTNRKTGRSFIAPSDTYKKYAKKAAPQLAEFAMNIDYPVNVKCLYYCETNAKRDLTNLIAATHDILVECKVLADDNHTIIRSVDGSRVMPKDPANPRVEIFIEEYKE